MVEERRRFPRAAFVCKLSTIFAERLLVFNTHTENIGEEGAAVIIDEKLHISTPVDVELYLSTHLSPLKCKGEISWVNALTPPDVGPQLYDTGIHFLGLGEQDRVELRGLVQAALEAESKK